MPLETLGDELIGDEMHTVGASIPVQRGIGRMPVRKPGWMGHATAQGVSRAAEELDFLPFVTTQLNETTADGTAIAFPQRPFRGERIVASASLITTAGVVTDITNLISINPAIFVGAVQVGASQGAMPLSAFAATAFGVRLSFPSAGQGTRIFIPYTSPVGLFPVGSGSIGVVTFGVFGRAVR